MGHHHKVGAAECSAVVLPASGASAQAWLYKDSCFRLPTMGTLRSSRQQDTDVVLLVSLQGARQRWPQHPMHQHGTGQLLLITLLLQIGQGLHPESTEQNTCSPIRIAPAKALS